MNLIEITVSASLDDESKTKNILLNLDKVVCIKLLERTLYNPERRAKWLTISTGNETHSVYNEVYAITLYESFQLLAVQNWTQEKLS